MKFGPIYLGCKIGCLNFKSLKWTDCSLDIPLHRTVFYEKSLK